MAFQLPLPRSLTDIMQNDTKRRMALLGEETPEEKYLLPGVEFAVKGGIRGLERKEDAALEREKIKSRETIEGEKAKARAKYEQRRMAAEQRRAGSGTPIEVQAQKAADVEVNQYLKGLQEAFDDLPSAEEQQDMRDQAFQRKLVLLTGTRTPAPAPAPRPAGAPGRAPALSPEQLIEEKRRIEEMRRRKAAEQQQPLQPQTTGQQRIFSSYGGFQP